MPIQRNRFTACSLLVALAFGACTGQSGHEGVIDNMRPDAGSVPHDGGQPSRHDAGDNEVKYDAITSGGAAPTTPYFPFCELVRTIDTGGLYRVQQLVGRTEEDLREPGRYTGFTYVHLELVDGWYNAEGDVVARISGGPLPDGSTAPWLVSLRVGEIVGLLLWNPTAENRGHHHLSLQSVFRAAGGGSYSNRSGTIVLDGATLGELVEEFATSDPSEPCPDDDQLGSDDADADADSNDADAGADSDDDAGTDSQ